MAVTVPFTTVTLDMANCVTGWENVITTENAPETGVVGPVITACKAAARFTVTVYWRVVDPSCAVTVTVIGLAPTASEIGLPLFTTAVALGSFTVGVSVSVVTELATARL